MNASVRSHLHLYIHTESNFCSCQHKSAPSIAHCGMSSSRSNQTRHRGGNCNIPKGKCSGHKHYLNLGIVRYIVLTYHTQTIFIIAHTQCVEPYGITIHRQTIKSSVTLAHKLIDIFFKFNFELTYLARSCHRFVFDVVLMRWQSDTSDRLRNNNNLHCCRSNRCKQNIITFF